MADLQVTYTGKTTILTAVNNCTVNYTLGGGGGGAGGADSRSGSNGLDGQVVNGSYYLNSGEQLSVTIGSGGTPGRAGSWAVGGTGGNALVGFAGGEGARSGNGGTSGSGGGGGGATVLQKTSTGEIIAVAAGGGGGGGGGQYSEGYVHSLSPYGQAPYVLYYSNAATNGAYCAFLNTYGIWNGNGHYTYEVYFPESKTYSFNLSADNYAYMWLDNGNVNGNNDYIGATPNGTASSFNAVHTFNHYVTAGWHTIDIYAYNYGGPASVAASVFGTNSYLWTTRDPYNPNSSKPNRGRGGAGQSRSGDHGGPGGGGGGYYGGMGGLIRYGDHGNPSGSTGYNYVPANGGTGAFSEHTIPSSYVTGGTAVSRSTSNNAVSYGNFGIAIFSAGQNDLSVRTSYSRRRYGWFGPIDHFTYWQPIKEVMTKISSSFQKVKEVYVRNNGVWKRVYGDDLPTTTTANTITVDNVSGRES